MEHIYCQHTIAGINHQGAIKIKLYDHSWLFDQLFKKLAIIEMLFWQGLSAGTKIVSIVERLPLLDAWLYYMYF